MGLEEEWRPIKDYEKRYWVSNLGQIKNKKGKILKPSETKDGYLRVKLWNGEQYKSRMIHCLVAEAFLNKEADNLEVDHLDNDRKNNIVTNLKYVTHKENLEKSFLLGHQRRPKRKVSQYKNGILINSYESVSEAFRQTGIRHISEAARKAYQTAGGYEWFYEEKEE